ncbi:MAG: 1-deoxy-D-xylulose-5-phosphate synthase [Neisseriaceae bacterium]|nr:MAG: 1-deoxy-D-xylulose-5-phosphate synthase [Neisseriaceae bacterium]
MIMTTLLEQINYPSDLKKLPKNQLPKVVEEIRDCFMQNISQTGGHFASNLGTIELTVALHYVFDTPKDHLIWDVGHQAYVHKLLTGRKNQMHTIRQYHGLSPFPKITESEYDTFGVGHSSTSISAALGLAIADQLDKKNNHTIAVIGDGAMTAGMAFEALNNAGDRNDINLLVILNDNEMSISNNVGALPKYLARNLVQDFKGFLKTFKIKTKPVLEKIPLAINTAQHIESKFSEIMHNTRSGLSLFNDFGFHYTGVIDGHNILALVEIFESLKQEKGPQLLHIHTKKGHGFTPAENDPIGFHAIGTFDKQSPPLIAKSSSQITFSKIFGDWIIDQATQDDRLFAITPAMREGSGLVEFEKKFPKRYFDVGIAEQHAVTFAAGLALAHKKPVVAIYSTFLQRAYDQLIHDVAIQNLPVLFAIDRAGVVGEDGPTHIGAYDISFLRCIPNMTVATPSDELECRLLLSTCYQQNTPSAVRYPRGTGTGVTVSHTLETLSVGKGIIRRRGKRIAILAFGTILQSAIPVVESLNATLADMRFVKPIDETLIIKLANSHDYLVTLEENAIQGGAGSAVLEVLAKNKNTTPVLILGIPDKVTEHGNAKIILNEIGLSSEGILKSIQNFI